MNQEWEIKQLQYELKKMKECFFNAMKDLSQYKHIEEELGVDLISFLNEMNHLIKNSSQTTGYTTSGKKIVTDYGYIEDFLKQLKEALQ